MTQYRKKLIEVALPLDAINKESAREKSIRHGHPSTLHLWWAWRPLAARRAVLFSQLVDDPSEYMPDEKSADEERQRLFSLIEELVKWENIKNEEVLDKARLEIARSVARDLGEPVPVGKEAIREFLATKAPPVLDPFAGGGSIPLEAQRLGLLAYASDLNPVAVLINKALIEIPPKFANIPPVHSPENKEQQLNLMKKEWKGAEGLAEDVRYYGKWMRNEAQKRIGHLYPNYKITKDLLDKRPDLHEQGLKSGDELTVIAWLWAHTVKCPNPACGAYLPLIKSFSLSAKPDRQAWIKPQIDHRSSPPLVYFEVKTKKEKQNKGTVNRSGAYCLVCDTPIPFDYIRNEGKKKQMGVVATAVIAESGNGQLYLPIQSIENELLDHAQPLWIPDIEMPYNPFSVRPPLYGFNTYADIFSRRQLTALSTFCDLTKSVWDQIYNDAISSGVENDNLRISADGRGATAYADAISTYLAFAISRSANYWSNLTPWGGGFIVQTFGRQALPMIWDYAEGNPFSDSTGNWLGAIDWIVRCLSKSIPGIGFGLAIQKNATSKWQGNYNTMISTDPPYYNNVDYADLSDYFYIWLRHSINFIFPQLFSTMLVPKKEELVANPYRFEGSKDLAKDFFEKGLSEVFTSFNGIQHRYYPLTIFYAFKQAESDQNDPDIDDDVNAIASTGWETMLEGMINAGLLIVGTWPLRTERDQGLKSSMNVLASSIVLVCRPRKVEFKIITRKDFLSLLNREFPSAIRQLQQGFIAPVDLAQAAIGPGMAVFSRYERVLEADGSPMSVRTALALINQALDEFLAEQEGEYDADTRWALAWYEQYSFNKGPFGVAETLSKAKNTSVGGLVEAGILEARAGYVRLLKREELKKVSGREV
jgi:putative DNA methylase